MLKTVAKPAVEKQDEQLVLPLSNQPPEIEDGFDTKAKRGPHDDGLFEHGKNRRDHSRVLLG